MASRKKPAHNEGLSQRAIEIVRLLAGGMSDREIAERLVMTINTVKWYNRQIYSILGVGSRTQAIVRARELNLLDEPEPALHIIRRTPAQSLPPETTRFIGREHELAEIQHLLNSTHLLTLVGPPGTGKTRLSLQIARSAAAAFRDGVYFVSLAPLSDAALVVNAIAGTIGVNETHSQPLIDTLKHALQDRHLLLILDNFEHLLPAATQVSELMAAAPHVKVLATSREPLHLYGEQEYAVPPLALPDRAHLDAETLAVCESTALFVQQVRAVKSSFELTADNAADIAEICFRLEGLPLAIELAAARIKLLTPRTLLARLTSRLDTLTGGAQDLPARQQTLHNTIAWSYNLLNTGEKMLFARLAVFRGGCSLEAIEAVCGADLPVDVFDGLTSLVNKSLVQQKELPGGESRFVMLETLHEYAGKRLAESGEAEALFRRHAAYFLELADHAAPELRMAGFVYWMGRLEAEDSNLSAALERSLDDGETDIGLRLVAALRDFWVMSSRFIQGENWAQVALDKSGKAAPELRVRLLITSGLILYFSSNRAGQRPVLEEAVDLARSTGDRFNLAWALMFLGSVAVGNADAHNTGLAHIEEAVTLFRELDHKPGLSQALNLIGELKRTQGDDEHARRVYEECLEIVHGTGEIRRESMILANLGFLAMHHGEIHQAHQLFRDSMIKALRAGADRHMMINHAAAMAGVIAANGNLQQAARLIGATDAWLERLGVGLQPGNQPEHERTLAFIRARLDAETYTACYNDGRGMTLEQMVASVLETD